MKTSKTLTTTLLLCCLGAMSHQALASRVDAPVSPKKAKPITLSSTKSFSDVEYIMGNYNHTQKLRISQAGSYELILKDKSNPRPLKKFGATFSFSKGGKVARLAHSGSVIFDLQPGLYDLSYFAKTYNPRKPGKFSISLKSYVNDIPPAVVPVPATAWLFGSGLLGLVGVVRRKAA
ncbi:MAG: hypothetical protein HZB57_04210 [Gammaproteobacteria bacterium]|nr:hypothetical protein [Gammaproteobacteria bacterium]